MRLSSPFRPEGEHIGIDLPGGRALFTTRRGGTSQGAFESLNLGLWTQDDPERVAANRERLAALMGVPRERLAHGRQVHGATVRRLFTPPDPAAEPAEADGQATGEPRVAPLVLVADCLPIALAGQGAVAMVHAGWRGLAAGVVEEGVAAVRELGAVGRLEAAIGPGAGDCCYRVGGEVLARFDRHPEAVRPDGDGSRLDLKAIAASRLLAAGVDAVHDSGVCTICSEPALFFSHRRDGERTGRQAGAVRRL